MSYKTNEEREIDEDILSELAMNDPENDYDCDDNDDDKTCRFCDGTGEGSTPDSLCYHCRGRGTGIIRK